MNYRDFLMGLCVGGAMLMANVAVLEYLIPSTHRGLIGFSITMFVVYSLSGLIIWKTFPEKSEKQ